ncbi:MAG: aldo/keto reductase, partial [Pseudomonadota bacterium]
MLESTQVGSSGLFVSRLCLGTMNFGVPGQGQHGDWTLNLEQTRDIIRTAIDSGVFYFDCADFYGDGASEEVVGKLLREFLPREEYVLATKIGLPMGKNRNLTGLSRKHILEGVDRSLQRLGLEYLDKLVIHRHPHGLPWHAEVPIEETLEALHDVVKAGKVLYLGASSMWAWQLAELQYTARLHGWTQFISMQNHYNLIYREEEREMIPYCAQAGVGVTPWSPLARGILTGAYRGNLEKGSTKRSQGSDA